jgi:formate hydrogenlyase subunit 6/NADH:ubiquinone oxidoreductase subunit I
VGPVRRIVPDADPPVRYFYETVHHADQLDLDFNYAVYSPRALLLPPHETLFEFQVSDGRFRAVPRYCQRSIALIGVHPCDIHAIRLLDRVFSQHHRDEHYLTRRANLFIVGVDCPAPCTGGVFCEDMGTNRAEEGFDVMLYPLTGNGGDLRYAAVFGSKAGREWLLYSRRCAVPTAADERAYKEYLTAKAAAFPNALTTPREELPDLLNRSYDSLLWEATARRCYSCGSCNLSCPTCYCFNILDESDLDPATGKRVREWDGCQLSNFALVAGDHNFRPKAASRLRHRIFRKALWIEQRSGLTGCVGCARCDRACTAKISCLEIYNQLAEEV